MIQIDHSWTCTQRTLYLTTKILDDLAYRCTNTTIFCVKYVWGWACEDHDIHDIHEEVRGQLKEGVLFFPS